MASFIASDWVADFDRFEWFDRLDKRVKLKTGQRSPKELKLPTKDARRILREVVRLVLDLPRNSTPTVVWTRGESELLVHSNRTLITFTSGVVTVTVTVECDQNELVRIPVPLGVGDPRSPAGLMMSSFTDLEGPAEIVETWFEPIVAFAWELLLEIASVVCAQVGKDSRGLPLVPGNVAAGRGYLLIQPIARHQLKDGL